MAAGFRRSGTALTTIQNAVSATGNGSALDVLGCSVATFEVTGTFTATVAFEASYDDGTTYRSIQAMNSTDGAVATSTTATGSFRVDCAGASHVRTPVTWTSGTSVTVKARALPIPAGGGISADIDIAGSETVDTELPAAAALADNTANPTAPAVGSFPHLFGGTTWDRARSVASSGAGLGVQKVGAIPTGDSGTAPSNATTTANAASAVVKASAGTLYGFTGYNAKASAQFILFYNSTTVPADSAQAVLVVSVPASSNFSVDFGEYGRYFSTGIAWSNSSTQPTKTVGSADVHLDAQYV